MKTVAKILLSLTVALAPATAVNGESPPQAHQRVLYDPQVPSQIRQRARTISATRLYGKTVIKGQNVALHFYDLQPMRKMDDYRAKQNSQLDVFVETRDQRQSVFKRVNAIAVTYERWPAGKLIIQMDVLWLDTASQTKPIVKVRVETRASSGEMSGDDILFTFPEGIRGSAVTQEFGFSYLSGPSGASSNSFDKADKNGFLTVIQEYVGGYGIDYTAWKWNDDKFSKAQVLHIEHDQPKRYKWNGEELVEK